MGWKQDMERRVAQLEVFAESARNYRVDHHVRINKHAATADYARVIA